MANYSKHKIRTVVSGAASMLVLLVVLGHHDWGPQLEDETQVFISLRPNHSQPMQSKRPLAPTTTSGGPTLEFIDNRVPLLTLTKLGEGELLCSGANSSLYDSHATRQKINAVRMFFQNNLRSILRDYDQPKRTGLDPGKNQFGQIRNEVLSSWVDSELRLNHSLRAPVRVGQNNATDIITLLESMFEPTYTDSYPCPSAICTQYPIMINEAKEINEAIGKILRYVGTQSRALAKATDCMIPSVELPWITGDKPEHFISMAASPSMDSRKAIGAASRPPSPVATLNKGGLLRAHDGAFPLPPETFSTRITKFRQTAWLAMHNICSICEDRKDFMKGYMTPGLPCAMSFYSIGQEEDLHHLQGIKRSGRNGIYEQREAAFQYVGHAKRLEDLSELAARPDLTIHFINGTTILAGAFAVSNVGHVINDALWGLTEALLIGRHMQDNHYTDLSSNNSRFEGTGGGSISTLQRPLTQLYKSKRRNALPNQTDELLYLFPQPIRAMLGNDFERRSSVYYASIAAAASASLLNYSNLFSSPFDDSNKAAYCFETLVAGGTDRELNKGHYAFSSRGAVAAALRGAVGVDQLTSSTKPIRVFVYGRNDVHRRSIDNPAALVSAVTRALTKARSRHPDIVAPNPIIISTFNLSPQQQINLASTVDVLVTIQGAHMQNSLFMPSDASVVEIAPCGSGKVSFLRRYGMYLATQRHSFLSICPNDGTDSDFEGAGIVNFSENDVTEQNITLCPYWLKRIESVVEAEILKVAEARNMIL